MRLILLKCNFASGLLDLSVTPNAEVSVVPESAVPRKQLLCIFKTCAALVNLFSLLSRSDHLTCTAVELNTQTRNCVTNVLSVQRGLE